MPIDRIAQLVATHAIPLLVGATVALVVAIIAAWHALERAGEALRRNAASPGPHRRNAVVAVALVAATVGTLAFGGLVGEVGDGGMLVRFDRVLAASLQDRLSAGAHAALIVLTHAGDPWTITSIGVAVAVVLGAWRQWTVLAGWAVALVGAGLLVRAAKMLLQRPRPDVDAVIAVSGWSLPSGHALGSLVAYGMLAYVLLRLVDARWHRPVVVAAAVVIVWIGASRVLLGVHYASDVLAGFAAGTAWLAACVLGTELARRARG